MRTNNYDVVIVGAGIAGCALAHALSRLPREKPYRVALLERSLAEPDRIVGELLQPGGVAALKDLGMEWCLDGIDAIREDGYCVVNYGKSVHIPYPDGHEGRSFHHGRFIMKLREAAQQAKGVEVMEATVTELIESAGKVTGVWASRKDDQSPDGEPIKEAFYGDLVVIADGCFSNFRSQVMGEAGVKSVTKSHFVGVVLEDATLPIPNHGTVVLCKGAGPVLLYQISEHDTRMLVDVKVPLPADLKDHILTKVVPQLPSGLQAPVQNALEKDRLRRMPNSFLPPIKQGSPRSKAGVILLGDSWNMRHPLTGGGMTVAFSDVVRLRDLLKKVDNLSDWDDMRDILQEWHWSRKPLASTVNILSVALYDLFGADDEELEVLRTGCFKYFEMGGECVNGPVSLLSGIAPSPSLLAYHFFSVAFYSIWVMFTQANLLQYPALFFKSIRVFWTACVVFGPLLWSEIRWWSPEDTVRRNKAFRLFAVYPAIIALLGTVAWNSNLRVL